MNHRQIETSREIRLWVTGIIGPVVIGVASVLAVNPQLMDEAKQFVKTKASKIKSKFKK